MPMLQLAVALGLLVLSVGLVLAPRKSIDRRALGSLRVLFPAWRFFESIAPAPRLQYRSVGPGETFGEWRSLDDDARPRRLLLNARGNLALAYRSLIERLLDDLESPPGDVTQLVSYRLVQHMVAFRIASGQGDRYQFMIASDDTPFVSVVHER